jgi:hypothetical protein
MSVETATAPELAAFTLFLVVAAAAAWWVFGFWGRVMADSVQSRSVDRRFMRWQWFAFRGRYPLGHWRKPWSLGYLNGFVLFTRAFIVLIVVIYFIALGRRILMSWSA